MRETILIVALALCAGTAAGQVSYLSGVQTNSAQIQSFHWSGPTQEYSYNESAPVGTESWAPAPQSLATVWGNTTTCNLSTTYSSTLAPDRLAFRIETLQAKNRFSGFSNNEWTYDKTLDVTFRLDEPLQVTLSAEITRRMTGGFFSQTPLSISLARVGDAPVFNLNFPGLPLPLVYTEQFPTTVMTLPAGDYRLLAVNHNYWGGGSHGDNENSDLMRFEMAVVPSPGGAMTLGLAGLIGCRRRRRL